MKGKSFILIIIMVLFTMANFFIPVFGQDIDVYSMDNTELTTLLLQIMQRLDQSGEAAETPEPMPTATLTPVPVPTDTPQPELSDDRAELEALLIAIMQKLEQSEETGTASEKPAGTIVPVNDPGEESVNSIWENKKLIIERLPSYMFIQPTKEVKPEKPDSGGIKDGGGTPGGGKPGNTPEPTPYRYEYYEEYEPPVEYEPPIEWYEPPVEWYEPPVEWYEPSEEWIEYVP